MTDAEDIESLLIRLEEMAVHAALLVALIDASLAAFGDPAPRPPGASRFALAA